MVVRCCVSNGSNRIAPAREWRPLLLPCATIKKLYRGNAATMLPTSKQQQTRQQQHERRPLPHPLSWYTITRTKRHLPCENGLHFQLVINKICIWVRLCRNKLRQCRPRELQSGKDPKPVLQRLLRPESAQRPPSPRTILLAIVRLNLMLMRRT